MLSFTFQHGRSVEARHRPDFGIPAGRACRYVLPVTTWARECCTLRVSRYHVARMTVFDNEFGAGANEQLRRYYSWQQTKSPWADASRSTTVKH
jgi:hypothetical protein